MTTICTLFCSFVVINHFSQNTNYRFNNTNIITFIRFSLTNRAVRFISTTKGYKAEAFRFLNSKRVSSCVSVKFDQLISEEWPFNWSQVNANCSTRVWKIAAETQKVSRKSKGLVSASVCPGNYHILSEWLYRSS